MKNVLVFIGLFLLVSFLTIVPEFFFGISAIQTLLTSIFVTLALLAAKIVGLLREMEKPQGNQE